jgi:hypothetical protein
MGDPKATRHAVGNCSSLLLQMSSIQVSSYIPASHHAQDCARPRPVFPCYPVLTRYILHYPTLTRAMGSIIPPCAVASRPTSIIAIRSHVCWPSILHMTARDLGRFSHAIRCSPGTSYTILPSPEPWAASSHPAQLHLAPTSIIAIRSHVHWPNILRMTARDLGRFSHATWCISGPSCIILSLPEPMVIPCAHQSCPPEPYLVCVHYGSVMSWEIPRLYKDVASLRPV